MHRIRIDGFDQQVKADERLIDVINRSGAKLPQVCYHLHIQPCEIDQ